MIGAVLEFVASFEWLLLSIGTVLALVWLVGYAREGDAEDATRGLATSINGFILGTVGALAVFLTELGALIPAFAELLGQYGGTAGQLLIGLLGWFALKTGAIGPSSFVVGAAAIAVLVFALRGLTS